MSNGDCMIASLSIVVCKLKRALDSPKILPESRALFLGA